MKLINYSEWAQTAHAIHMITQMMGKVKLRKMAAQPEWNHSVLQMTAGGFTTGLIPDGERAFTVEVDLAQSIVLARCTSGVQAAFPLREGGTIGGYYAAFRAALAHIGHPTEINPVPQECATVVPFGEQDQLLSYDASCALAWFDACNLAHSGLLRFAAPFRGKKILPSLFWGTFDLTTVLFAGEDHLFSGSGLIEKVAFDERLVEFGFWPGDEKADAPSFFVLAYPFLTRDLSAARVRPAGAFYSPEKMEYFLPLKDALAQPDPAAAIYDFCCDSFAVIAKEEQWPQMDWFQKPLLV